jgi:hypothetical protein
VENILRLCCKCLSKEKHKTSGYCKPCLVEYSRNRYEQKKDLLKEQQRIYVSQNKQKILSKNYEWKYRNLDAARNATKNWKKKNAAKVNAQCKERRLRVKNSIPCWVEEEELWMIEQAYDLAQIRSLLFGIKFHVDHIIPIKGKNVCGLHAPNNLQVIPAIENYRKGNRIF